MTVSRIIVILSAELPPTLAAVALTREADGRLTFFIPLNLPYPAAQRTARALLNSLRSSPRRRAAS